MTLRTARALTAATPLALGACKYDPRPQAALESIKIDGPTLFAPTSTPKFTATGTMSDRTTQDFSFVGTVDATVSPAGISGTFVGAIVAYSIGPPKITESCASRQHQFVMTPLNSTRRRR